MKKPDIRLIAGGVKAAVIKHCPEILTGVGISGMFTAGVLAVRATPKALTLIDKEKERVKADKLTAIETVKTTWTCYVPSVLTAALSTACIIGANSVNLRRNAALAAAYTLSESAFKEYRDKVVETVGEKKDRDIRDAVAEDKVRKNPVKDSEIVVTGNGDALCYDAISGRYFNCNIERIRHAENDLNRRMRDEMTVSLNDFYYEIGLPIITIGEMLGWNIDRGYIDIDFSTQLTSDGKPCLVINYRLAPLYDFKTIYSLPLKNGGIIG